jgi:glycosyltransferase involved in cell wall biosynthesis
MRVFAGNSQPTLMNILVLASDIPATTNMPGSPRLFNLCKALSREHRLTLAAFTFSQERYETFLADRAQLGVFKEIVVLPNPGDPIWWRLQVHRLRAEPYFVTRHLAPEYHAQQCRQIRDLYVRGGFDVLYADGLTMAQYVLDSGLDCPAIIDLHDSLSLLFSRTARAESHWLKRLALRAQTRSIERWEKALGRRFRAIITNSRVDQAFLKSLDPAGNVIVIGNGVDSEFFTPTNGMGELTRLVFTGVMDYGPNEDAAIHFCDAILPLIQERYRRAEFWVVGKYPTERVRRLSRRPGVHVTGGVPDVRPFLEAAGVFVCPLRVGSGVKNKILAALAMRKAVVATPLSLEGLDLLDGEHLLAADGARAFADRVSALIEDPGLADRIGRSGQAFVRARYSWQRSAALLEGVLFNAASGPGECASFAGFCPAGVLPSSHE